MPAILHLTVCDVLNTVCLRSESVRRPPPPSSVCAVHDACDLFVFASAPFGRRPLLRATIPVERGRFH
eukprot:2275312-Pyramimonas_sp.AAC.1